MKPWPSATSGVELAAGEGELALLGGLGLALGRVGSSSPAKVWPSSRPAAGALEAAAGLAALPLVLAAVVWRSGAGGEGEGRGEEGEREGHGGEALGGFHDLLLGGPQPLGRVAEVWRRRTAVATVHRDRR